MAWYRQGTISLTNGSTAVTGAGTAWIANAAAGEALLAPDGKFYEIASINSDGAMTLGSAYLGATIAGQGYVIVPTQSYIRDLAAQAAALVNNYSTFYNTIGQGKFTDGTLAAPGMTFATDTDTGFFHSGTNEVTFVANGVAQFKYDANGITFLNGNGSLSSVPKIGIGVAAGSLAARIAALAGALTGATTAHAFLSSPTVQVDVTSVATGFATSMATLAAAFTLGTLNHFQADQGGFGAGSTVTTQAGFNVQSTLVGATNNYGFRGQIPAGTNRYNLYMDGTASNYLAGKLGVGLVPNAAATMTVQANATGGTTTYGQILTHTVQSDVTAAFVSVPSLIATQAASFTLADATHFRADQGTVGAGSAITNQNGFRALATLIGATNNYGFRGQIPSGTGRYNLYMDGTADNYLAGRLSIGVTPIATTSFSVGKSITGGSTAVAIYNNGVIQSDVGSAFYNRVEIGTAAAAFTLGSAYAYYARQGTVGAGSSITAQYGFISGSDLYQAGSNYAFFADDTGGASATTGKSNVGFRANLSAATGGGVAWNFYATGTAPNYFAGSVGIGSTSLAGINFAVVKGITGATTAYNIACNGTVQSDVTGGAFGISTYLGTQAAAFTLPALRHVSAGQNTFGAGSTVTNQYGFSAESTLIGATNNYGFYGNIPSGTGRYNFYAAGTAQNYFGGDVIQKLSAAVTPANNSEMMIQLTSNTQLTIKVKGTDGTVRSANLTLA